MIKVLLVDDHTLVRAGLQRLLEQTGEMKVIVADRGETAVDLDAAHRPDVVLMDVSMPGMSGVETTRRICGNRDDASVVMLTAATDHRTVTSAIDAGAIGYLVKDSDPADLIAGIRSAANGEAPLDGRAARSLLEARSERKSPSFTLTTRETEVLRLVAKGLANKAIAARLEISEKTVKAHLTRVFASIGVSDRTQAALWAGEHLGSGDD